MHDAAKKKMHCIQFFFRVLWYAMKMVFISSSRSNINTIILYNVQTECNADTTNDSSRFSM